MLSQDVKIIVNNEITLELPKLEDAKHLFALVEKNRSHLKKFLFWVAYYHTLEDSKKFITESRENAKKGKSLHLLIRKNDEICGAIGFHDINRLHNKTEIGFWLAKEYEKKGIVTKSCKALIDFAFETLKMHRIEMCCATSNLKSQKIASRLGFAQEGLLRKAHKVGDAYLDLFIYSLLNTD